MKVKTLGVALFLSTIAVAASANVASADHHETSTAYHVVTAEAPTLSEVSKYLYGKARWWKKIAQWNNMQAPYHVALDQKLVLEIEPTLSPAQGKAVLISMWKRLNNEFTQERLSVLLANNDNLEVAEVKRAPASVRPAEKAEPEIPKIEEPKQVVRAESPKPAVEAQKKQETFPKSTLKEIAKTPPPTQTTSGNAQKLFEEAEAHFKRGEFEKAQAKFQKCRELDRSNVTAWIREIESLRKLGHGFEAIEVADALEQAHPNAKKLEQYKKAMN